MEQSELLTVRFEEYNEQFQYLIAVAFALLLVEFWLLDRRNSLARSLRSHQPNRQATVPITDEKPFLLLSLLLTFGLHADCAAWGTVGHRAIAEVAQRHLTPKAKAAIERYTGGTPLAEYAVFMDEVAADPRYKEPFRGWHASIADAAAACNSPAEVREKYRKGRDGVTGAETLTAALKNYRELDDSVVLTYIKCIVHMVADFHCPAHVRYTDAHNEGKFDVTFFGKPKTLHSVWDSGCRSIHPGWSYERYADYLDNASKCEIRRMTEGSYRQWFEDAARDVRPSPSTG